VASVIIAIDESGSFEPESDERSFFVAVHLRQRKTLYDLKRRQHEAWERSIPRSAKNAKGEIKGSALNDDDLLRFARQVVRSRPVIGITPYAVRGLDNPPKIVDKHRAVVETSTRVGVQLYNSQGKLALGLTVNDFGNWYRNLGYVQYMKTRMLGWCIHTALVNTVGHSISGGYDTDELPRIRYKIDRDFIKQPQHLVFWRILLRNQIWAASKYDPLPILDSWKEDHPFLETIDGERHGSITEIFQDRTEFLYSHQHFEIRIADAVATILNRFFNRGRCTDAYKLIAEAFLRDGKLHQAVLNDFDLTAYRYDPADNPWART
jgi:hypothetical protein